MFACFFCISIITSFFVENGLTEEVDVEEILVALKYKIDTKTTLPTCVASVSFSCSNAVSLFHNCYFQAFFTTLVIVNFYL